MHWLTEYGHWFSSTIIVSLFHFTISDGFCQQMDSLQARAQVGGVERVSSNTTFVNIAINKSWEYKSLWKKHFQLRIILIDQIRKKLIYDIKGCRRVWRMCNWKLTWVLMTRFSHEGHSVLSFLSMKIFYDLMSMLSGEIFWSLLIIEYPETNSFFHSSSSLATIWLYTVQTLLTP